MLFEVFGRAQARVDDEAVLANLLFIDLVSAWLKKAKNFHVAISIRRLELGRPILEDLTIRATITLNVLTLEDCTEGQMRFITMRFRLAHLGDVDVLELLTGLDKAWLSLGLLLILLIRTLIRGILHAAEYDFRN